MESSTVIPLDVGHVTPRMCLALQRSLWPLPTFPFPLSSTPQSLYSTCLVGILPRRITRTGSWVEVTMLPQPAVPLHGACHLRVTLIYQATRPQAALGVLAAQLRSAGEAHSARVPGFICLQPPPGRDETKGRQRGPNNPTGCSVPTASESQNRWTGNLRMANQTQKAN